MSLSQEVEKYIENPMSDGYTAAKIISKYGEEAFQKEMQRVNGWKRHAAIVKEWYGEEY